MCISSSIWQFGADFPLPACGVRIFRALEWHLRTLTWQVEPLCIYPSIYVEECSQPRSVHYKLRVEEWEMIFPRRALALKAIMSVFHVGSGLQISSHFLQFLFAYLIRESCSAFFYANPGTVYCVCASQSAVLLGSSPVASVAQWVTWFPLFCELLLKTLHFAQVFFWGLSMVFNSSFSCIIILRIYLPFTSVSAITELLRHEFSDFDKDKTNLAETWAILQRSILEFSSVF